MSGGAGRPREFQTDKQAIVAHVLFFMNLASDIMAIAVAVTSLLDTALRRRSDGGQ
jgi:hypothetical protein